jgi:hypothetical protein
LARCRVWGCFHTALHEVDKLPEARVAYSKLLQQPYELAGFTELSKPQVQEYGESD